MSPKQARHAPKQKSPSRKPASRIGDPVLVVGSGVHAYAGHKIINWSQLLALATVGATRPIDANTSAPAIAWEGCFLDAHSGTRKKAAAPREEAGLSLLATELDKVYKPTPLTPQLQRLHDADIADLVIFNFDRGLHKNEKRADWSEPRRGPLINNTRTWYPHGHTKKPRDLVLGARRFGLEIARLEKARGDFWAIAKTTSPADSVEVAPTHWLHTFLENRTVTLIGLGLSPDEWTIWWALTQRARRFAQWPSAQRPVTRAYVYFPTSGPIPAHAAWLADATAALGIDLEWFTDRQSDAVWEQTITTSARTSNSQGTPTKKSSSR